MIRAFTGLMELFEPSLGGHSKRVALLAMGIGEQSQMETAELRLIEISALLHDIGLVGLPRSMLQKGESELSERETALIRQHPAMGHATLNAVKRRSLRAHVRAQDVIIRELEKRHPGITDV